MKEQRMEGTPIAKIVTAAAAMSLSLIAAIVFLRRVFGALPLDLGAGEAAFYAACFSAVAFGLAWQISQSGTTALATALGPILSGLALIGFVAGLATTPHTLALALMTGSGMGLLTQLSLSFAYSGCAQHLPQAMAELPFDSPTEHDSPDSNVHDVDENHVAFEHVEVQLTRGAAEGLTKVEGYLTFECSPKETVKHLHFPIWPPLPSPPTVEASLEGFPARVRVTLSKTYGFRIEVRRLEPSDTAVEGVLHVIALSRPANAAA